MTAAGWIIAIISTLVVLALVAGAIYWLASALIVRTTRGGAETASAESSAREIIDRRLASGEITPAQHEELREALDDGAAPRRPRTPAPRPTGAPG